MPRPAAAVAHEGSSRATASCARPEPGQRGAGVSQSLTGILRTSRPRLSVPRHHDTQAQGNDSSEGRGRPWPVAAG